MGLYDQAWERIVEGSSAAQALAEKGFIHLSADTLRQLGGKEPRLLAKWDTLSDRPKIVSSLGASLLPLRNGLYLLFRDPGDQAYFRFEGRTPPARPFPSKVDLTDFDTYPGGQLSESQALDFAHLAGIFQDFAGDETLRLTLRGRLYSGKFSIAFPHLNWQTEVDQVQIEIDAGFEGRRSLLLVEAKRGSRDHALIRQLWYPYLAWRNRTPKPIIPIFFTYLNGQALLTELHFTSVFGEVEQRRMRAYALDPSPPATLSLSLGLEQGERDNLMPPENAPFPQANDLDKLTDLLLLLAQAPRGKEAIASAFGMEMRQADYYANAGLYLGLVQKSDADYTLTEAGRNIAMAVSRSKRSEALARHLFRFPALRAVFKVWQGAGRRAEAMDKSAISALLDPNNRLSEATSRRRADGLVSWIEWVASNSRVTE